MEEWSGGGMKNLPAPILHYSNTPRLPPFGFHHFPNMHLTEPIIFEPLFMERVWGGRHLESLFGKHLPPHTRIGESWEIVDRDEAQSVVHNEPLRGKTLHDLWTEFREPVFGDSAP